MCRFWGVHPRWRREPIIKTQKFYVVLLKRVKQFKINNHEYKLYDELTDELILRKSEWKFLSSKRIK